MDDIVVSFLPGADQGTLRASILVEGLPGIGYVGKLVAEHLIEELGAEKIAEIHSIYFPPQVIIGDDGTIRLSSNELYFFPRDGDGILFLVGDHQSGTHEGHYRLADRYLGIASMFQVRCIYTLGGFGVGHLVEEPRVLAAVNRPELRPAVEAAGGVFNRGEPGGGIVGAAGLLLGLGRSRGMDGICLMGETSGYLVDPMSAASLLRVLSGLLGITVDPTRLQQRGAEMEQVIQHLIEGERISRDEELRYFV